MGTILYIEDETDLLHGVAEVLTEVGHEVLMAKNGWEGLKLILAHKPDLVISDINMPNMTGKELLAELKEMPSEFVMPPFLFLTALFDEKDKAEGLKLGAVDYLVKPIELDDLISKVEAFLPQNMVRNIDKEVQVA